MLFAYLMWVAMVNDMDRYAAELQRELRRATR